MVLTKSTTARVSGSLAGPLPPYSQLAGLTERLPVVGEVAVEVDPVGVAAHLIGDTVGIDRFDQPEVDPGRHVHLPELVDDRDAGVLVAVDDADHEHDPATRLTSTHRGDRRPCTDVPTTRDSRTPDVVAVVLVGGEWSLVGWSLVGWLSVGWSSVEWWSAGSWWVGSSWARSWWARRWSARPWWMRPAGAVLLAEPLSELEHDVTISAAARAVATTRTVPWCHRLTAPNGTARFVDIPRARREDAHNKREGDSWGTIFRRCTGRR